jgi:predicted Fe-Mo cluster-binding NifX family protein
MKIGITAKGKTLDSPLDPRFGRAEYLLFVDSDTLECEAVNNAATAASGGAGIVAAQAVVEKGVQAVITGSVGPNAISVLQAAQIAIYQGQAVSVRENIALYRKTALERIAVAVPAHSGLGNPR